MTTLMLIGVIIGCLAGGWWMHAQQIIDDTERHLNRSRRVPLSRCRILPRPFDQDQDQ